MKTASELDILDCEYEALQAVRDLLHNGKLSFCKGSFNSYPPLEPKKINSFNMEVGCRTYECKTVGCIGGWAWIYMHQDKIATDEMGNYLLTVQQTHDADDYVHEAEYPLNELYYPNIQLNYSRIKISQAVEAIDNFLEGGDPLWKQIIGEE